MEGFSDAAPTDSDSSSSEYTQAMEAERCRSTQLDSDAGETSSTEPGLMSTQLESESEEDTPTQPEDTPMQLEVSLTQSGSDMEPWKYYRRAVPSLEAKLRQSAGLSATCALHPAPRSFRRLTEARSQREELIASGEFNSAQVGIFARDVCAGGAKTWIVDTFPGFALASSPVAGNLHQAPATGPWHFYEVFLEGCPCWQYFDLEYAREPNPTMEPADVATAFRETLDAFCLDALGLRLDPNSIFVLDSTTPAKFSKHVIVKGLRPPARDGDDEYGMGDDVQPFAWRNNAQAGVFVSKLVEYIRTRREMDPTAPARLLFASTAGLCHRRGCV